MGIPPSSAGHSPGDTAKGEYLKGAEADQYDIDWTDIGEGGDELDLLHLADEMADPPGIMELAEVTGVEGDEPFFYYLNPRPNAKMVSPFTSVALRPRRDWRLSLKNPMEEMARKITVKGEWSGEHEGATSMGDDGQTLVFQLRKGDRFAKGEKVFVRIHPGLKAATGQSLDSINWSFRVSNSAEGYYVSQTDVDDYSPVAHEETAFDGRHAEATQVDLTRRPHYAPAATPPFYYRTVPSIFPRVRVVTPAKANKTARQDGLIFFAPRNTTSGHDFLTIMDEKGRLIYWQQLTGLRPSKSRVSTTGTTDFRVQDNGHLWYYDPLVQAWVERDKGYRIVRTRRAGHGYRPNRHTFRIRKDGTSLAAVYDLQPLVIGGKSAQVAGSIVQEIDSKGRVLFEWRSIDHPIISRTVKMALEKSAGSKANLEGIKNMLHLNSVDWDKGGNILISLRRFGLLLVDRHTGQTIWQLGHLPSFNQFTYLNDPRPFSLQHSPKLLDNGNLLLFDNSSPSLHPRYSRAVEYRLELSMGKGGRHGLRKVWEYKGPFSPFNGNAQRLSNGNTAICWGGGGGSGSSPRPVYTEVTPAGEKVLEFQLEDGWSSRAFRLQWDAVPHWPPSALFSGRASSTPYVHYSFNGATNIKKWKVLSGTIEEARKATGGRRLPNLVKVHTRRGFEHAFSLRDTIQEVIQKLPLPAESLQCFQAVPVNYKDKDLKPSKAVCVER
ncbi:unnamed protein product [Vitrella brassicaformis CCMP3155]|uniref:Uncharacterized protein n=1 Tax=Vitrella brassicaformis (strain CCMP3155) TaxID=1169540 RepID=A0A0G4FNG1_VITBC|nr:unnamed protein product [Vitrella brassicaformis CCMP3155]|eukprot:CEM15561.1 unnamed protein product [Vitrella brassicaformis CCMP3155]